MKGYKSEQIKNIAVLGHQGSGKTSLIESLLLNTKIIGTKGLLTAGTTVSDFLKEEKDHQMSISNSLIPIEFEGFKFNFIDTPGFLDLTAEVTAALRVASAAVLVVDAQAGVQVGTEKYWNFLRKYSVPTILFINKMDRENIEFDKVINELKEKFGNGCMPLGLPIGVADEFKGIARVFSGKERIYTDGTYVVQELHESKEQVEAYREKMMEAVAEASDELMEKYFEGEPFTSEEITLGAEMGMANGTVTPILIGSCEKNIGTNELLEIIKEIVPGSAAKKVQFADTARAVDVIEDTNTPFSGIVFKTVVDPFLGQLSYVQVKTGRVEKSSLLHIVGKKDKIKFNQILFFRGKETAEADYVSAGDICVFTKVEGLHTGDTIADMSVDTKLMGLPVITPTLYYALIPKTKNDDDKIGSALARIVTEDRSVEVLRPKETGQLLFGGQGQKHIELYIEKLKNQFKVEVDLEDMEIVYRETIKGRSDVQGKYKKQSGGSGQYGDVKIKFAPTTEEFEFVENIFGGSVPRNYIPAVEKGLLESIQTGGLAGYPVIGLQATLYDGSYHAVDSSELAFRLAAGLAFKEGFMKAKPTLLEPIMDVAIRVPNEYTGDVMGDMSRRRGIVRGMEPIGNIQVIKAKVPQAEMLTYTMDLKSLTQARGSFEMKFDSYQECPHDVSKAVIARRAAEKE